MVEGASDGARRLVILMRISFSPLLQGARRCAWRRRREGQRLSSGEAGAAGDATGQCLCSVPPPPPKINKVGVEVRVGEFVELPQACRLALSCISGSRLH